jgi:TolA-binding protein
MRRNRLALSLVVAGLGSALIGCVSAPVPAPSATQAMAANPDDDVVALKERVGRLERRLADVDAKLGLLLAQRTPRDQRRGGHSITNGSLDQLGPRDLIVDEPRAEEASLGARAVDLPRRRSASSYDDDRDDRDGRDGRDERDDRDGRDQGSARGDIVDDDGAPPVMIKLHGSPSGSASEGGTSSRGARESAALDVPSFSSVDEAYSWAQMRLKEGRHLEAISALEDIVTRSPGHDLADNSVYWIGWAHQQRGDHKLAVDVWQRLPLRYGRSAKVPDALFGMAQSHEAMGEPAVAETLYEQLVAQYPKAERVKDAKKALARLRPR